MKTLYSFMFLFFIGCSGEDSKKSECNMISPASTKTVLVEAILSSDSLNEPLFISGTIYDSLGHEHIISLQFIHIDYDKEDSYVYEMLVQVDGKDVGDPDTLLASPENLAPTEAIFYLYFDGDGQLQPETDIPFVSNWVPTFEDGTENGALGPQNVLEGGALPIPEPPTSSNFTIDIEKVKIGLINDTFVYRIKNENYIDNCEV